MKKTNLKIVIVTIFAALLSGCTWLNTETEGGISRGKLLVGMVAFGAGIGGIVHSDSDGGDAALPIRPATLPVVGIATSDTAIEGEAVTLIITSDRAAPASGLNVTVDISGADGNDFDSAACTGLRCVIVIPSGMSAATLTIMALSDPDTSAERWIATIVPNTAIFRIVPANANADFIISETDTLPMAMENPLRSELNAYTVPITLAADAIRNLRSDAIAGVTITASRYDNPSTRLPQVYVQRLEFAALGIWVNDNTPEIGVFDHDDYDYAFLGDNVLTLRPASGMATYDIEGDATYKGVNFFPDGILQMDFEANTFTGSIGVDGATTALNHFGSATAMVPDGSGNPRSIAPNDVLSIDLDGMIGTDEFTSTPTISTATGFFGDLATDPAITRASFSGRFYDAAGYTTASGDPSEVAGAGLIEDGGGINDLHFGFLGRCSDRCAAGD